MAQNFLHPDRQLAVKYVIAAFFLFIFDYFIPYIGIISLVLLFLGIPVFMHEQNNHFKTARKSLIKMSVFYIIMRLSVLVPETGAFQISTSSVVRLIAMGISTIYYIYTTHYFTEGILLDAKTAKINFVKLGLNTPWIMLGVFVMLHFICVVTFRQPLPSITAVLSLVMCVYYCIKLYNAFPKVYGMPKKETA